MISSLTPGGRFDKVLCGIAALLLCGAPTLITIGIVLMVTTNTERDDKVDDYNAAVAGYQPGPVGSWVPATINGAAAAVGTSSVAVASGTDATGVNAATSTFVQATIEMDSLIKSTPTIMAKLTNVFPFNRSAALYKNVRAVASCPASNGCSSSAMKDYCQSIYGPAAVWQSTADECRGNGDCGVCVYTVWLTDYCVVVEPSTDAGTYRASAKYQSCYYPFGEADQVYDSLTRPSSITLTVRKSDDPFIAMQRVTEGDMDFQPHETASPKAIKFIVAGCALLFALCFICCILNRLRKMSTSRERRVQVSHLEEGRGSAAAVRSREPVAGQPIAFAGTEPYWTPMGNDDEVIVLGQPIVCPYGESTYIEELTQPMSLPNIVVV